MGTFISSEDDLRQRKWATNMVRYLLRYNFDGIQLNFDYPGSQARPVNWHPRLRRFLKVRVCVAYAFMCVCSISLSPPPPPLSLYLSIYLSLSLYLSLCFSLLLFLRARACVCVGILYICTLPSSHTLFIYRPPGQSVIKLF